jgi:hypothetical protein
VLITAEGAWALSMAADATSPIWERCEGGCGREYRFPHLCRTHRLCGLCHPPVER